MEEASHEDQETYCRKPDVQQCKRVCTKPDVQQHKKVCRKPDVQHKKVLDELWCHLCKIKFEMCEEFCMHIMRKHKPSSKYYEGNNNQNSEVEKAYPLETVQHNDSEDLDISVPSYEVAGKSSNDKWLNSSSAFFAMSETLEATQIDNKQNGNNPKQSQTVPMQNSAVNNQVSDNQFADQQSASYFCACNQTTESKSGTNYAFHEKIMQEKDSLKFPFNRKNIIEWDKYLKDRFGSLQFPLPKKILKCMKNLIDILLQFCRLSPDEETVSVVQKIVEEITDILERHDIFMQQM